MARRTHLLDRITRQLSVLATQITMMGRSNRLSLNADAETIFCGLINRLEGWNLRNLNEVAQNYPGIDLADPEGRIAVQITASASQKKVDHTLEVFFKNRMERAFSRLIIVITTDRTAPTAAHGVKHGFAFDPKQDIWNIEWFKRRAESVEDCELLQAVADYLDSQLGELPGTVKEPEHLLPPVPAASECFLEGSRDPELDILEKDLEKGGPVFIWGLGGMGKTQTAIALARRCAPPRGAYFLRYTVPADPGREAMFETIRRADLTGYWLDAGEETDPEILMEREYRQKLEILRREYGDTLLIIDNFDWMGKSAEMLKAEQSYQDVAALANNGVSLVFTTRYPSDPAWEIRPLAQERLLELMRRSCADYEDGQLLALIRAVGGHTLMVDLMAKTLEESWQTVTPAQLMEALKNATLDAADFPAVTSDKDGLFAQAQIYRHLQALFNVSGLTAGAKKVLSFATLIAEEGLDDVLFLESLPAAERKELQNLCRRGWLRREDHVVTIHPAVLQVCRGELKPEEADVLAFLDALWGATEKRKCTDAALRRVALCMGAGAEMKSDQVGSVHLRLKALSLWERILPEDHPELAARYGEIGMVFYAMDEPEKALEYNRKSLTIKKNVLPQDHPDLALSYRNMGKTLRNLGDFDDALAYQRKSLEIWKRVLPANHPDLANAYCWMGDAYFVMMKFTQARDYLLKALQIQTAVLTEMHPDTVYTCGYLGRTYRYLDDYENARLYLDKARSAMERSGEEDTLEYGFMCMNSGEVYMNLDFMDDALGLFKKALRIFEKELDQQNIHLAMTRSYVAFIEETNNEG